MKCSAGILLYRTEGPLLEVLLVHPGGPFWKTRDDGAWSIPKGEPQPGEPLLAAAQREFTEETGFTVAPPFLDLGSVKQKAGKVITAFAARGNVNTDAVRSNEVELEWPRGSGRKLRFPEVDRAAFFDVQSARTKINPAQVELLKRLESYLAKAHA